ncbi:phage shock protein A [Pseudanabaena sp. lw0831]|uniref:PspA/IM30 family protein n=1 Tax=Pseudanabaena sp. lw0831 TaxID=1357935 RepID=UPI001915E7DA|nr:PspA/IM30 family protein [Pseudanabaena sp. lw0831]GBO54964.1 phage shock protein A [Pseudanabaena sp. lw0831]
MGLPERIIMVLKSNLNAIVSAAEDPEKILEQLIFDMQEDLAQLRQSVAQAIAALKVQEQQYNQSTTQAQEWEKRAMLAIQKGDDALAKEALSRKKTHTESANTLKAGLQQQTGQVELLKKNLTAIAGKISEAKTKKELLKVRLQTSKSQENLNNILGSVNTTLGGANSAEATFARMEEKVLKAEALASANAELSADELGSKFAQLESVSDIDDELAELKAKIAIVSSASQNALPPSDAT